MKVLKRVVTALSTAAAVVAALLLAPVSVVVPAMILLSALVHLEFCQMVAKRYSVLTRVGVVAGVAYMVNRVYGCPSAHSASALAVVFFLLALRVLFGREEKPVETLAVTAMGFLYVPVMLTYFVLIPKTLGIVPLLFVIAVVKLSDMGGFAIGMTFGRHKMCPSISPNKSWEGLLGSVLGACLMASVFKLSTDYAAGFSWARVAAFGVAAALVGTLGDLVESRMKREVGVKDSATFMPAGLGGFLDMFDSLIFAPALLYPFL